ncbi:membrane-bound lytic murein transglycosylase MltF [Pseudomonadota bacterium]
MIMTLSLMLLAVSPIDLDPGDSGNLSLNTIKDSGVLRVVTVEGPTTYYSGPDGIKGFEYDLVNSFAEQLDLSLEMIVVDDVADIVPMLQKGEAHFAAAGLAITERDQQLIRFSPPLRSVQQQVVYSRGQKRPKSLRDLRNRQITVLAESHYSEQLQDLGGGKISFDWTETKNKNIEELLLDVWQGNLDLTIANSDIVALTRQHYPELQVGFSLPREDQLAWAFRHSPDKSLYAKAAKFIKSMKSSGQLDLLIERYFSPAEKFNYTDVATYLDRIETVLPDYDQLFQKVARDYDIDWRLLAAQAYQESQWNPNAVSYTGVRGMMQLTNLTAGDYNVTNRTDAAQSVRGGGKYLTKLIRHLPESIKSPDRIWMALASYNVGYGHLEDARVITARQGGDPDLWSDVKKRLPLLAKKYWYKQTKFGYARGRETTNYVARIRMFYDILVRMEEGKTKKRKRVDIVPVRT